MTNEEIKRYSRAELVVLVRVLRHTEFCYQGQMRQIDADIRQATSMIMERDFESAGRPLSLPRQIRTGLQLYGRSVSPIELANSIGADPEPVTKARVGWPNASSSRLNGYPAAGTNTTKIKQRICLIFEVFACNPIGHPLIYLCRVKQRFERRSNHVDRYENNDQSKMPPLPN